MVNYYDVIGIGIGPFNLSLAALTEKMDDLACIFFDDTPQMEWHPGMLIEGTDLQVPFLADLVSFADPTNYYSYLNYLHIHKRLFPFYFFHKMEVPRKEYNHYLQWAANNISGLHFGKEVIDVMDKQDHYQVFVHNKQTNTTEAYFAKHLVMATGTKPLVLDNMKGFPNEDVLHTSRYLHEKETLIKAKDITLVGSGQSAAEIFYDLLEEKKEKDFQLTWLTRSEGIFQLEAAKLGQEFFSPDYVDYFHELPLNKRKQTLDTLDPLRKGIDYQTLNGIYRLLYHFSIGKRSPEVTIQPLTEIKAIKHHKESYQLECHQWQADLSFTHHTDKVILATGYQPNIPSWFINRFKDSINWEDDKLYQVDRNYALSFKDNRKHHVYVATNLEHSHGTAATNLGLAVQRNMEIINDITNEERFDTSDSFIFQQFKP
ncbi:lysine N(6)-hydroxylase/L-ornithine N(5)-oxygenase family protein [Paraliobacillus ryukyuensis]|uniref:lysine N(6)-hydroxylase/L-ornithine N(5)-oxygenase family protein n=1 Tax=Paraliobacillus ryukyuensis TaxID=200904 RepID=UPI0009A68EC7|nr:SidA/IucD/PvdA family monooxygenase [Paraliobacillus ryukyuensis]